MLTTSTTTLMMTTSSRMDVHLLLEGSEDLVSLLEELNDEDISYVLVLAEQVEASMSLHLEIEASDLLALLQMEPGTLVTAALLEAEAPIAIDYGPSLQEPLVQEPLVYPPLINPFPGTYPPGHPYPYGPSTVPWVSPVGTGDVFPNDDPYVITFRNEAGTITADTDPENSVCSSGSVVHVDDLPHAGNVFPTNSLRARLMFSGNLSAS